MSRIREKASESEAVVRNITKDIQVLDLAKKNLITSMTTLKRLQMLGETHSYRLASLDRGVSSSQPTPSRNWRTKSRRSGIAKSLIH